MKYFIGKRVFLLALMSIFSASSLAFGESPLQERTPELTYAINGSVLMTVVDNRPFVLSGDKPDTCEGIRRNAYGMPFNFTKLRDDKETPYTKRIEEIVSAGLTKAGATVAIVPTPNGTSSSDAIGKIKSGSAELKLVINVLDSRVDAGIARWSYFYDYELNVIDGAGAVVLVKRFTGEDVDFQRAILKAGKDKDKTYSFPTVLDIEYGIKFSQMLGNGEVRAALGGVVKSATDSPAHVSNADRLSELKKLLDQGLITDQDFERKKAEILDGM